jgi:hypothetical protein
MAVEEERKSCFWVGGLITSLKGNHYGYMMNITPCCWNMAIFKSAKKTSKRKPLNCRQIWLDCEQQSENAKPGLLCWKYNLEPITRVVEYFLIFPTVICMPRFNEWFRSYEFLNIGQAAVSLRWQTVTNRKNCIFDHRCFIISENLQYQTRS